MCFCSALNDAAPYGKDIFSIVGEAISLPFASVLAHFGRGRRPRRPILDFSCHPERSPAKIPLSFASCFFVDVILSEVEIRAKRGSNDTKCRLGSRTKKFDKLRMTPIGVGRDEVEVCVVEFTNGANQGAKRRRDLV